MAKDVDMFKAKLERALHTRARQMKVIESKRKNKLEEFFKIEEELEKQREELIKMYLED